MSWESYKKLSWFERGVLHEELSALITHTDGDGEGAEIGPRPKDWRK